MVGGVSLSLLIKIYLLSSHKQRPFSRLLWHVVIGCTCWMTTSWHWVSMHSAHWLIHPASNMSNEDASDALLNNLIVGDYKEPDAWSEYHHSFQLNNVRSIFFDTFLIIHIQDPIQTAKWVGILGAQPPSFIISNGIIAFIADASAPTVLSTGSHSHEYSMRNRTQLISLWYKMEENSLRSRSLLNRTEWCYIYHNLALELLSEISLLS